MPTGRPCRRPGRPPTTRLHAPYLIHPLAPLDLDQQIPKKGDQRQMEPWQRIGTYAAGLALESAGVKGDTAILPHMDMIVAAGGGERDQSVDSAIMTGMPKAAEPEAFLNERLTSDLRPTLFLAQLSNLLAGNISIVHGVTGSSRTFMGEESAGVNALRIALARIEAGQSDIGLVGGSYNADRPDSLMLYEFAGYALKEPFAPVWERQDGAGFRARLDGRLPGDRGAATTRRRAAPAPSPGSARPVADNARRQQPGAHQRRARTDVVEHRGPAHAGAPRHHFRRHRRRAGDRRGARLPGRPSGRCGARHRQLSRAMGWSRSSS